VAALLSTEATQQTASVLALQSQTRSALVIRAKEAYSSFIESPSDRFDVRGDALARTFVGILHAPNAHQGQARRIGEFGLAPIQERPRRPDLTGCQKHEENIKRSVRII
jgi:hypothetical protein